LLPLLGARAGQLPAQLVHEPGQALSAVLARRSQLPLPLRQSLRFSRRTLKRGDALAGASSLCSSASGLPLRGENLLLARGQGVLSLSHKLGGAAALQPDLRVRGIVAALQLSIFALKGRVDLT
jgi:hypothetical protein